MTWQADRSTFSIAFRILAFVLLLTAGFGVLAAADFNLSRALETVQATDPLTFVLLMSLLPLLGFPIAAFYLYAGSIFPWWIAWLCCSLALAVNMALAYPIAKYLLRGPISEILARYRRAIPDFSTPNQFRLTFLVRAVPGIPYFMQNYFLPLLGIRFLHYWIISWVVQTVIAAGMTAVPDLVEKTGWVTAGIVLALFIVLGILHRIYIPRRTATGPGDPRKPIA